MSVSVFVVDPDRKQRSREWLILANRVLFWIVIPLSLLSMVFALVSDILGWVPKLVVKQIIALRVEGILQERGETEIKEVIIEESTDQESSEESS